MSISEKVDMMKEDIIKSVQEIIRIKSVRSETKEGFPFGYGTAKALEYALSLSKKMGFKTVNLDNYCGYAEYGQGNEYVGVLGHLDVVPEGDGWKYPPYAGEIHDGKIYGRGTTDDKGPIIAALYSLKAIKDCGLKLNKRVRIIFGTNEETGSKGVKYYVTKEETPISGFTPDAAYPLINGEKGAATFSIVKYLDNKCKGDIVIKSIKGGNASNMVPDKCSAVLYAKKPEYIIKVAQQFSNKTGYDIKVEKQGNNKLIINSVGLAAHGSLPHLGKNAIMQLFKFLSELNIEKCDIIDFIEFMNDNVGMETNGKSFGIYLEDESSGELSFNVGIVDVNESKAKMVLNLRHPVTKTMEDMMNPFKNKISNSDIKIEDFTYKKSLYFEIDNPIVEKLLKVYQEQTGMKGKPISIGGGTYAKTMPNIVPFGPIFPGKPDLDHQTNEYIEIEDLILNSKIYGNAIYELAK